MPSIRADRATFLHRPLLFSSPNLTSLFLVNLLTLTVGLGRVVTLVNNQVLRVVVLLATEVAGQDSLGASGVTLLRIDGGTRHVRDCGVTTLPLVLGSAQRVLLGSGLNIPDITTVTVELARLKSFSDILLDDDGTTSSVNKPSTCRINVSSCLR